MKIITCAKITETKNLENVSAKQNASVKKSARFRWGGGKKYYKQKNFLCRMIYDTRVLPEAQNGTINFVVKKLIVGRLS